MIVVQAESFSDIPFSDSCQPLTNDAAAVVPIGLPDSPNAASQAGVTCLEVPNATVAAPHAGPVGVPAVIREPYQPVTRPRRIRKAPARVVSVFDARLADGQEIVGPEGNRSPWYLGAKRLLDIVGALVLLLVLSPIMLTTYLMLLLTTRGHPIFRQERLGYRGRPFTMYKFRTMRTDAIQRQHEVSNDHDGPIFKNRRDPRITRLGRLLRSTSIDETPQLFNVLLGQMSLVGPRPPLASEVSRYQPWHRRRLTVKPGLTCLWQVSGRSEIGFHEWVRMDLWYVKNQGLRIDMKLLAKTPWSVLSRRGAY